MKKFLLLALLSIAFGAVVQAESPSPLMKLPLIDSVKLGDFDIHKNNESHSHGNVRVGFLYVGPSVH